MSKTNKPKASRSKKNVTKIARQSIITSPTTKTNNTKRKVIIAGLVALLGIGYFGYKMMKTTPTINVIDFCGDGYRWDKIRRKCIKINPTPVATTKPPTRQTPKPTRPPVQKRIPNQKAI